MVWYVYVVITTPFRTCWMKFEIVNYKAGAGAGECGGCGFLFWWGGVGFGMLLVVGR